MADSVAPGAAAPSDERRLAVVDLGSNTFRLVVFRHSPGGGFRLADEIREPVRLAAGAPDGRLAPEAIERAARAARLFASFAGAAGIDEVIPVATSALRDAANRDQALERIGAAGGLRARVLSAGEEARYGVLGALNSTTLRDGLVLDVGGGSVQVGLVHGRALERSASEPLGAVRMTEAFLGTARPARGALKALRRHVAGRLAPLDWIARRGGRLLGVGGSVRTLAVMAQKRDGYPLDEVHGFVLTREALGALIEDMAALPARSRDRLPGLKTDRADIMLGGAVVVDAVMERVGADRLEVCAQGLREGVFYERYLAPRDPPLFPDVRRASVLNVARVYRYDAPHAEHVAALALNLYEELARLGLHAGDDAEREWLWAAGLLHDVGVLVDYNDHHKHSYYLVLNAGLPGFGHRELALVALLVRAHRKGPVSLEGLGAVLEPGDEDRLGRLAACLRIAEHLERGRANLVRSVSAARDAGTVRVTVAGEGDARLAVWSAAQQAGVFERGFGRRLELVPAR
jgi:exopolyphosphatase/guanosine-5'-triphosphate,3'-diphosphate pyrophosphatase